MVICDFDIERVTAAPLETDPPLVVDADAVLSVAITTEFFKPICWWYPQVVEIDRIVDHSQFTERHLLNIRREFTRSLPLIYLLCFSIFERFDHGQII